MVYCSQNWGGYLLSADQAPAGTKRLSNLLRCTKWQYSLIERFLWSRAQQRVAALQEQQEDVLALWDESVLEKSESIQVEGLCAVRSSRAARLKRTKPGYFNPPGGRPIFVPGMHWLSVLLVGAREKSGPPTVAAMQWWTTRGEHASEKRTHQEQLLRKCAHEWGDALVHVFDRGFAGGPWLQLAFFYLIRFVMRWPRSYTLIDEEGVQKKAWQITRGKRSWQQREVWDAKQRRYRSTGVVAAPVRHPLYPGPLWLVVSRPGKGREPWYLLTSEPALTAGAHSQGRLAHYLCVCQAVADRNELPLRQERTGYGKPSFMEVGEPSEAAHDGNSCVCFSALPLRPFPRATQAVAPEVVVSQKRKEEPRCLSSSLPIAFSYQPPVV